MLSRRAEIWIRLMRRFLLEETSPSKARAEVAKTITPITDADKLARVLKIENLTDVSVTALGTKVLTTVPAKKRWIVHALYIWLSAGDFTLTTIWLRSVAGVVVAVKNPASATTQYYFPIDGMLELEEGWQIAIQVPVFTTTGTISSRVYYEEEDAY